MLKTVCLMIAMVVAGWSQTLTVGSGIASPGQTIDLALTFTAGSSGCYTSQFDLVLPVGLPVGLVLVSERAGAGLPPTFALLFNLSNRRTILLDNSGGVIPLATGVVAIYSVRVDGGAGNYAVSLQNVVASNSSGSGAVPVSVTVGSVNVGSPPAMPVQVRVEK